jgi:O-antigen ligase
MEFILAIGALVGLFWVGVVLARGGLVGGALLVLLAGSCFGHPFFKVPFDPVPLTADRLLLAVLVIQYLVYRRWGWADPKPLTKTDYLLAALLIVVTASALAHDFQFKKMQPLSRLGFFYLMPAVMYWMVREARWTERAAWWLFSSLGVFGLYLCLTAVAETHQAWAFVFPKYIQTSEYREFLGRGRGPLLNPVANGLMQGLGLCAAVMWWPRLGRPGKLLLLAILPLFAWGVYSTFTRSAWIGAGLGLLVVVALSTPRSWRVAVLGCAVLGSAVVLAGSWDHLMAFKRDQDLTAEDVANSARLRPVLAVVAWHMFLDRPILGCGFGQYEQESPAYLSDRTTDLPLETARPYVQHNVFLAILTETGIVGMGLFVALLVSWSHTAWRLWRAESAPPWVRQMGLLFLAFMAVYLANGMFHDITIIPMVNMVLFFLAGSVMALAPRLVRTPARTRPTLWEPEGELAIAAR